MGWALIIKESPWKRAQWLALGGCSFFFIVLRLNAYLVEWVFGGSMQILVICVDVLINKVLLKHACTKTYDLNNFFGTYFWKLSFLWTPVTIPFSLILIWDFYENNLQFISFVGSPISLTEPLLSVISEITLSVAQRQQIFLMICTRLCLLDLKVGTSNRKTSIVLPRGNITG